MKRLQVCEFNCFRRVPSFAHAPWKYFPKWGRRAVTPVRGWDEEMKRSRVLYGQGLCDARHLLAAGQDDMLPMLGLHWRKLG